MEYYSAMEKNEKMPFSATWIGLETIMLNEASQRERQKLRDIMWNLNYDTNELTYKAETDSQTENKLMVTKGKSVGRGKLGV